MEQPEGRNWKQVLMEGCAPSQPVSSWERRSPDRLYVFNRNGQEMQDKKRQLHHEEHEVNEVKPGSAGRLTGFIHFAVPATNASPLDHARRAAGGK